MDRAAIAKLIPHGDAMCMLDGLSHWDDGQIECVSDQHRAVDNPLRESAMLHSACLVEFCAQAAALHGALSQPLDGPRATLHYLGAVKGLQLHCQYLDASLPTLRLSARRVVSSATGSIYQVEAVAGPHPLLRGRIVLVLANAS